MARVRCRHCGTEQEAAKDSAASCVICGRPIAAATPEAGAEPPAEPDSGSAGEAETGLSKGISQVYELEEGDLSAHAASLPEEAPKSRFLDVEELFAGEKRSATILSFVPLWGLWRISRSAAHSGGEKLFLSVLSIVLTVAIAFALSQLQPGQEIRVTGLQEQVERQITALSQIVEEFAAERGDYPEEQDWEVSASQADPRFYDPWGRAYIYKREPGGFRIGSYGRDGKPGGRDEDADIFRDFGRRDAAVSEGPSAAAVEAAEHVFLAPDGCPTLDLARGARVNINGAIHVNALCESPATAIRLAEGARLDAGTAIGLVSPIPVRAEGVSPPVQIGLTAAADPLAAFPAPAFDGRTFVTQDRPGGLPVQSGRLEEPATRLVEERVVLSPGVYWGGIRIVSGGEATLQPGEYVLAGGGLLVLGTGKLAGEGVVLYNTLDPVQPGGLGGFEQIVCTEESRMNLSAPTSGTFQGLVFFQDRANHRPVEIRCALALDGTIYAPSAELRLAGAGGTLRTRIVVGSMTTQGSFTIEAPTQSIPTPAETRQRISPTIPDLV